MSDDSRVDARVRGDPHKSKRGPAKQGRTVKVTVYASGSPLNVNFSHEWQFENGHREPDERIRLPAKKKSDPATPIEFKLVNDTHPHVDLAFLCEEDAIWVSRCKCPRSKSHDPEISFVGSDGETLRVLDHNKEEILLYYTLRFAPEPRRYLYDPEIKNGGIQG